jgi:hypothetical protein
VRPHGPLSHIFFVDRFDSDVGAMQAYGWSPGDRRLKSLAAGGVARGSVRDALRELEDVWKKLQAQNEDDFELYAYARKLADKRDHRQIPGRRFTASLRGRPESDRFEFLLYCAYEAHALGQPDDVRALLGQALRRASDEDLAGFDRGGFADAAIAAFASPAKAAPRPERQVARNERQAAKSAARGAKMQRKLQKKEKKEQKQAQKSAKAAKKARKAASGVIR